MSHQVEIRDDGNESLVVSPPAWLPVSCLLQFALTIIHEQNEGGPSMEANSHVY